MKIKAGDKVLIIGFVLFYRKPFLEDWATLFRLLAEGKIRPVISGRFPLLEAAQANVLLESGQVVGNLVLVSARSSLVSASLALSVDYNLFNIFSAEFS